MTIQTRAGLNGKYCPACKYALPAEAFDLLEAADDGLSPFCKTCVAREPWRMRATCSRCGSSRKLSKFPGADHTKPCTVCEPYAGGDKDRAVTLALRAADLVRGTPKTAAELLEDIGYFEADRSDVIAAGKWLAARGFERGTRSAEKVFYVGVRHLETGTLEEQLEDLDDLPAGRMTVTEFLAQTGVRDNPSKADLNAAARWLRAQGFSSARLDGRRVFDLGKEEGDDTFYRWCKTYPGLADRLGLTAPERRRLWAGATPSRAQALAMSALIAGLPPYA